VLAGLFFFVSLLPSLLPRPWWAQGIVSGLSLAIGYGFGLLTSSLYRYFIESELSVDAKKQAWRGLRIGLPIFVIATLLFGSGWQNEVRSLVGVETIGLGYTFSFLLITVLVFLILIFLSRGIRKLGVRINKILQQHIPPRLGTALALGFTAFIVYYTLSGLLVSNFYRIADASFGARDNTAPAGIMQPVSPLRSGSQASVIPWGKIGFQGRGFVGSGPTQEQISEFTQQPAIEPIRVYAGLASADSAEERAQLAVADLKRTKAFERKVLVIATATGTGWLDPKVVDALEFMHDGNTAIVSQQYSYLPSWISFLVDQARAREAGRVLYDAVLEEYSKLPENSRPKLLVYGLSLGSFGGQEAFSGVNDIRRSVDGALFAGTPNTSTLWRRVTNTRDAGSPEWQPIYQEGRSVRFASSREDMLANQDEWTDDTRILFIQHANDPVVWFSFDLLFNKPDWLDEPRGRAVSDDTRWFPIVTFLQITVDQAVAASAPIGHGHYYIDTPVYAWGAVLEPNNWSIEKADKLQDFMNSSFTSQRVVADAL